MSWRIVEQGIAIDQGPSLVFSVDHNSATPMLTVTSGTDQWLIAFPPGELIGQVTKQLPEATKEPEAVPEPEAAPEPEHAAKSKSKSKYSY